MAHEIVQQLEAIRSRALAELGDQASPEQIENVRVRILGRSGDLTSIMRGMRDVAAEERPAIGKLVNEIKVAIESRIEELSAALQRAALEKSVRDERLDVTLPGLHIPRGRIHPLTQMIERMLGIFASMGFEVATTQDVEDDFHNFEALNFPPDHPAREMQDSFYLPGGLLLRTHATTAQVRMLEKRKPPMAIVSPGACYRRDEPSVRALPTFNQIDGFMVDRTGVITMAHLKGVLTEFIHKFLGSNTQALFRTSYFPFTEPSAEVDVSCTFCNGAGCSICKHTGRIEILGCGMIHPNVLRAVGHDPMEYQGFAFGMGVDRLALRMLGVDDMRLFIENDLRFLNQF